MANRAALRELQTRLAARLQAARTEGVSVSWLAVKAGSGSYLFPLVQSGEIFPLTNLQTVPYCQNWFSGVVNLRGGLFGVVDLARFIADGQFTQKSELAVAESSVITLHSALEVNCALLVDSLSGLKNAESFSSSAPPDKDAPAYFGNSYVDPQGVKWQEINLQFLSQLPQFLSISA